MYLLIISADNVTLFFSFIKRFYAYNRQIVAHPAHSDKIILMI